MFLEMGCIITLIFTHGQYGAQGLSVTGSWLSSEGSGIPIATWSCLQEPLEAYHQLLLACFHCQPVCSKAWLSPACPFIYLNSWFSFIDSFSPAFLFQCLWHNYCSCKLRYLKLRVLHNLSGLVFFPCPKKKNMSCMCYKWCKVGTGAHMLPAQPLWLYSSTT